MAEGSRWPHSDQIAGGMATRCRGSCPLTFFATPSVASVLTIPWRVASQHSPPPFGQKHQALSAGTEWLFWPGLLVGDNKWLGGFVLGVVPPVRLHEHGVDLLEIDDFGLVAHRFYQGSDAEVLDRPQRAFGKAQDEIDGLVGEGLVREAHEVELVVDEGGECRRRQSIDFGGVGDTAFEILLRAELEGGVESRLADEDEVVVFREVFQHEPEFMERIYGQKVGVVDDGDDGLAFGVLGASLGDEA